MSSATSVPMIVSRKQHVAVIGGGFSGTMAAVNLARLSAAPIKVTLFNHGSPQGRGIAYSTQRGEHLLNVAARNMSALPDHPNHFLEWLRTRAEFVNVPDAELRETFMPRRVYGDYLRSLAYSYLRPIDPHFKVEVETVEEVVVDIKTGATGAQVILAGGREISADKVILATGNETPAELPGSETLSGHAGWCPNPWQPWESRLPVAGGNVVLLGTGLTSVDAILTMMALDWKGTIHAVSRNGLLPQSHFKGVDYPHFPPADVDLATLGLDRLVKLMEEHCERLRHEGLNPAVIVDKMRPHTQRVWAAFSEDEKRRFIKHHSARWNVIRHRIAPSIHGQVTNALENDRLKVVKADIVGVKPMGGKVGVDLRHKDGTTSTLEAGLVVNCTGPHTRFSATRSVLLQNLLKSGLAQSDALDMGVKIEPDFAVVERGGKRSPFLFAIGPLLRGTFWETIAVPELRGQALKIAQVLLAEGSSVQDRQQPPAAVKEAPVIEYMI